MMHYGPLISKVVLSFLISSSVLYRYGNWYRHRIVVTLVVLLAWFFSFLIIFALPLDIISTVYRNCLAEHPVHDEIQEGNSTTIEPPVSCKIPWNSVPEEVFPNLWRTVYWSTQCLTWLFMPMMQSYIKAGDFTVKGKLKSALIDNAIYYGSYLFICGVLLIYLATRPGIDIFEWAKLKAIASSASNTWGLFLLVLLLGYALVAVPRSLWNNSSHSYVLNHAYFKAAKLSSDKAEAEETVDDVLESLQAISKVVNASHPMYQQLETILQKVPSELRDRMNRRQLPDDNHADSPGEKSLVRLHKQVIKSLQVLQRTETQWNILIEEIFSLEDTLRNMNSRDRIYKHTFDKPKGQLARIIYNAKIEWYWKCKFSMYLKKVLAVLAAFLSTAVVWSEVTFFNKQPVLSIFANIVNVAKKNYDYSTIEILSTAVILYLCYCAYSTVLKIRVLNLYYLAPHHQTNEYSLIFSGMMLSRLTPPLCLNFLGVIHMDSHIIKKQILETDYTQIMGHMDVIKIISDGFNIYFPMAILFFCLATYFSLGARILSAVGFHQFIGDDEITTDLVNEGREFVKREKRKRQRTEESISRRRDFNERFQTTGRFRPERGSTDTIRSIRNDDGLESTRTNLLKHDGAETEIGSGTRYVNEVDTRFPPTGDLADDIDARFGISTHGIINERNRVGAPRGIFDDV
ncbi:LMBR1 domain-containing protein 2 homolog isoform X2 [Atheta coriaria]|uniref:LMBR1 domain-containing protein 2 homolog isoform X2 n=1 Tax=Dalotia coriaria TaxID=877792 RepID=UPI0031F44FDC